ncbi:translation initiation factor 2 [Pseudomonas sp. JQ170]|uniref:translation initiation factor 2 n=1 Tax=unclassified Pseudomonas TaxID=196821 RepID=UPI002651DD92|nr:MULTISPECIES: translation initiation factor 2 [unclassified Pseudomonas]MDN7143859.1 translation initiation factor 2 [Pseudomonas sp. JQ170]WRO77664.1 translation initiation factor 2 [Pseudomonas sp. 170C]
MKALRGVGLILCLLGVWVGSGSVMVQAAPEAGASATEKVHSAEKAKPPVRHKATKPAKPAPEPLPSARVDLSLPAEMVKDLKPASQDPVSTPKPLLPYLFGEKPPSDSPFQLNGRLLSNEMQLQLRNDARQEIEGAAIEFEFKQ